MRFLGKLMHVMIGLKYGIYENLLELLDFGSELFKLGNEAEIFTTTEISIINLLKVPTSLHPKHP